MRHVQHAVVMVSRVQRVALLASQSCTDPQHGHWQERDDDGQAKEDDVCDRDVAWIRMHKDLSGEARAAIVAEIEKVARNQVGEEAQDRQKVVQQLLLVRPLAVAWATCRAGQWERAC